MQVSSVQEIVDKVEYKYIWKYNLAKVKILEINMIDIMIVESFVMMLDVDFGSIDTKVIKYFKRMTYIVYNEKFLKYCLLNYRNV